MRVDPSPLTARLTRDPGDIARLQQLRYAVFAREQGAHGPGIDHAAQREADRFDAAADHLVVEEGARIVGCCRLMGDRQAAATGGFYSAAEFDISPLERTDRPLLELSRTCIAADYRGSAALMALWQGVATHAIQTGAGILFGVASFPGARIADHAAALSLLQSDYAAPAAIAPLSRQRQPDLPHVSPDRRAALGRIPPLIRAYLRLGGRIGRGAFADTGFDTTDICMVLDIDALSDRQRRIFGAG